MSSTAIPITPAAFALAIADLPLGNLHAKAAELHNSISHLVRSNEQLLPFAQDGDTDCADAIRENEGVIARMQTRIDLLRQEVEKRGFRWGESEAEEHELMRETLLEPGEQEHLNGTADGARETSDRGGRSSQGDTAEAASVPPAAASDTTQATHGSQGTTRSAGGSLTDAELQRRLVEQFGAPDANDNDDEGVYL